MRFTEKMAAKNNDIGGTPVTAAFLGDSVTHGCFECYIDRHGQVETVYERQNAYAQKFARIMSELYPRAQLNIINSGISGGSSAAGLLRLERDVLRYSPDLVVVNFALNDCMAGKDGVDAYGENMRKIFAACKAAGAEVILLTSNVMCAYVDGGVLRDEVLRNVAAGAAEKYNDGTLDLYVARAKTVAAQEGVHVCDVYAAWKALERGGADTTALLSNRINHPTRNMQWLFACKLTETLFGM